MVDFLLALLGYIILRFRYPNKNERQKVLKKTYDDSYITVGAEWPLKIIGILFFVALFSFLIIVIYRVIFFGPS